MNLKMLKYPSEFSVVAVDNDVIVKEIKNVDCKNPVPQDIPVRQSKLHNDIFSSISIIFSMYVLRQPVFPTSLN